MRTPILILTVLCCSAFTAAFARAEDVRFPVTGDPAFTFHLPDDWTHRLDDDGNMIIGSGDHSSGFSLSMIAYDGDLDTVASEAMKVAKGEPPVNKGATNISGYNGYIYDTTMANAAGVHLNVHMIAVKLDEHHVASATMITADGDSADQIAAAQAVLNGMQLTAH